MKKFFFYFFICLAFQFFSLGHAKWFKSHCQKINNTEIKCTKTTEEKFGDPISFYKKTTTYVGEGKNGLPSGKGEIEMSYSSYSQKDWEDEIRFLSKTMKGVFEFLPDIELVQLIDGIIETNLGATQYYENSSLVKTVFSSGTTMFFKNDVHYKTISADGWIFEGISDENNEPLEGTVLFKSGDKFTGKFKNGRPLEGTYYYNKLGKKFKGKMKGGWPAEGTLYYENGDKFTGTFDDKGNLQNGKYFFSNGQISYLKNGKTIETSSTSSGSKTKKTSSSDTGSFGKYFLFSWIFTFILWGIVIAYFYVLGLFGWVVNKVPFKAFKEAMFFVAFCLTWFLCWVFLFGFIPAIMFNALFIYLAVWGALGIGILHIITMFMSSFKISKKTKKMFGKYEGGAVIVFILFWCLLSLDFIPFLGKYLRAFLVSNNLL